MMFTPVIMLNSTSARWFELPTPAEAELSVPGRAFASASNSCTERAGSEGCTTKTLVIVTTRLTGARSRVKS